MSEILYDSKEGTEFVRKNNGGKAVVTVRGSQCVYMKYRFPDITQYEHPMLSWENLDKCGGWDCNEEDILVLVLEGKKPAGELIILEKDEKVLHEKVESYSIPNELSVIEYCPWNSIYTKASMQVITPGHNSLSEIFDLDDICKHYEKLGLNIKSYDKDIIRHMMEEPLLNLLSSERNRFHYDFANSCKTVAEDIVTGLLLGYPLESTYSIIEYPYVK